MSDLKEQLIKLGSDRKGLRQHIRPVLDRLSVREPPAPSQREAMEKAVRDSLRKKARSFQPLFDTKGSTPKEVLVELSRGANAVAKALKNFPTVKKAKVWDETVDGEYGGIRYVRIDLDAEKRNGSKLDFTIRTKGPGARDLIINTTGGPVGAQSVQVSNPHDLAETLAKWVLDSTIKKARRKDPVAELLEAADILLINSRLVPDPQKGGHTELYGVPFDDIDALKDAVKKVERHRKQKRSYSNGDYGDQSKNRSFYPDDSPLFNKE